MQTLSLFILVAGFIIGLGAVTVIDLHGFLGRKSEYWTLATTRTHKVTKPLIWIGTFLVAIGVTLLYRIHFLSYFEMNIMMDIALMLGVNGFFLSFVISPYLLAKEKEGKSSDLLPQVMQNKIIFSFIVSFLGWWSLVLLFVNSIN